MNSNYEANFIGCLLGLAIGEALGSPLKSLRRSEIAAHYGIVRDYFIPAETENVALSQGQSGPIITQALIRAESIVATGGKVEPLDFGPRFLELLKDPTTVSLLGEATVAALERSAATGNYQSGSAEESPTNNVAVQIAPIGLLFTYGIFDKERFLLNSTQAAQLFTSNALSIQGAIAVAIAVRSLAQNDLLTEDLMSAALDYLPFGLMDENPLREKLLAAQDYLEERQTLVDNIEAGDLAGVDLFRVDLNNMERCGVSNNLAETVAAAFYAFTARKESFEEAVTLALNAGGATGAIAAVTGALAGAYHGWEAIPERWRNGLADYAKIVEAAKRLHKTVRSRELTDYVNTGI